MMPRSWPRFMWLPGRLLIAVWVFEDNSEARRFYETMGFHTDGVFKTVELGKPLKVIRYTKTLVIAP